MSKKTLSDQILMADIEIKKRYAELLKAQARETNARAMWQEKQLQKQG